MSHVRLELLSHEVECADQLIHGGDGPDGVAGRRIRRGDQRATTLDFELQLPPATKPVLAREGKLSGPQGCPWRHCPQPVNGIGITSACRAQELSSLTAKLVDVWPVGQSPHGISPSAERSEERRVGKECRSR